ncbi:hypothetical protein JXO52_07815 [bacterium]|nr:hypothetical protein [bacterium]
MVKDYVQALSVFLPPVFSPPPGARISTLRTPKSDRENDTDTDDRSLFYFSLSLFSSLPLEIRGGGPGRSCPLPAVSFSFKKPFVSHPSPRYISTETAGTLQAFRSLDSDTENRQVLPGRFCLTSLESAVTCAMFRLTVLVCILHKYNRYNTVLQIDGKKSKHEIICHHSGSNLLRYLSLRTNRAVYG